MPRLHSAALRCVDFANSMTWTMATGGEDCMLRVWDMRKAGGNGDGEGVGRGVGVVGGGGSAAHVKGLQGWRGRGG